MKSPDIATVRQQSSLLSLLEYWVKQCPDRAFCFQRTSSDYQSLSYQRLYESVVAVSGFLMAQGIKPGDRVGIWSKNQPEWVIADLAIYRAGAVVVPIYNTVSLEDAGYHIHHSGLKTLFVDLEQDYRGIQAKYPELCCLAMSDHHELHNIPHMIQDYDTHSKQVPPATNRDDLASIVYTSGTSGKPKGVMISHANFLENVGDILESFPLSPADSLLSFLPLAHVFERTAGYYAALAAGVQIYYAQSAVTVAQDLLIAKPSILIAVPRFFEKIYQKILGNASGLKRVVLDWAIEQGNQYYLQGSRGAFLGLKMRFAHRLVFDQIRAKMGGNIQYFISGGAPLSPEIWRFFESAGFAVVEGYGQTEASPVISLNPFNARKEGSIGKLMSSIQFKLAKDGELWVKGPNVMQGYWQNPEATADTLTQDGYLKTGDIVQIDEDQYFRVVDRKKDLIVLSTGKNIAPARVEALLKRSPLIEEIAVIGDKRSYLTAIIWVSKSLKKGEAANQAIQASITAYGQELSHYEQVKQFHVVFDEFNPEYLTPTLKKKRRILEANFKDEIDALYPEDCS